MGGNVPPSNIRALLQRYERGEASEAELNTIVHYLRARLAAQERMNEEHEAEIQRGEEEQQQILRNMDWLDRFWEANNANDWQVKSYWYCWLKKLKKCYLMQYFGSGYFDS